MQIILVRHGPVALKAPGLLSFDAFRRYIDAYERSGIEAGAAPPPDLARLVESAACIFASDAPRVAETLRLLRVKADVSEAAFRETPPTAPRLPFRLPEIGWLALARARGAFDPALAEARGDLLRRARNCAGQLAEATHRGSVALIGHGWFNRAVGQALAAQGWRKCGGPGFRKPWGHAVFEK